MTIAAICHSQISKHQEPAKQRNDGDDAREARRRGKAEHAERFRIVGFRRRLGHDLGADEPDDERPDEKADHRHESPADDPGQPAVVDVADPRGDRGKRDDADRLPYRGRVALDIFKRIRIQLHRTDYPISKSHPSLHRRASPGALSVAQSDFVGWPPTLRHASGGVR